MKTKAIQVALYPTPAPETDETLYQVETLPELLFTCEKLFLEHNPFASYDREGVQHHFEKMAELINFAHHLEVYVAAEEIDWERMMTELARLLPQFVWLSCCTQPRVFGRKVYYLNFIPLVMNQEGFPFELHVTNSIQQQLGYEPEDAIRLVGQQIEACFLKKEILITNPESDSRETSTESRWEDEPDAPVKKKKNPSEKGTLRKKDRAGLTKEGPNQLVLYQEAIKRDQYVKERLRIANAKMELVLDKLEISLIHQGLHHFDQMIDGEDSHWDKRLVISLREYSILIQKAKHLEQMWQLNVELVKKTEKMTVSKDQWIYERDQIQEIKDGLTSKEIYFVLGECQMIEARVRINTRPWFRKPYVKLMKMDYDSLLDKAAYFDLLQGESYLMEKQGGSSLPKADPLEEVG